MDYKKFKLYQALRFRFEDNMYVFLIPFNFFAASVIFFLVAMLHIELVEKKHYISINFSTFFIVLSLISLAVGCVILIFRKLKIEIKKWQQKARF